MDAVLTGRGWQTRRMLGVFLAVFAAALLIGGFGGYLIRGVATLVSHPTATTYSVQAGIGPLTEAHDIGISRSVGSLVEPHDFGVNASRTVGPLTEPHDAAPSSSSSAPQPAAHYSR